MDQFKHHYPPVRERRDVSLTTHTIQCANCGEQVYVTQEAIDAARTDPDNEWEGKSDAEVVDLMSDDYDCYRCAGILVPGEHGNLADSREE